MTTEKQLVEIIVHAVVTSDMRKIPQGSVLKQLVRETRNRISDELVHR